MGTLFSELSRRRVLRVAGAYAVVSWFTVQVADAIAPALNLPEWSVAFIIYILVLCFPISLLLAWAFDVSPKGIVSTPGDGPKSSRRRLATLSGLTVVATAALFLVLAYTGGMLRVNSAMAGDVADVADLSVAVIPFADHSPEGGQDWFAAGLTEDVLDRLTGSSWLRVAEGADVHAARAGSDVREVGQQLGVATLLTGSIRRVSSRVRVSVRLTDANTGYQLWSASYDGRMEDILDLQREISGQIERDINELFAQSRRQQD